VTVDAYTFSGSNKLVQAHHPALLDTGSSLNTVPADVAAAYNAAFEPPATINKEIGYYATTCKATVPSMVVTIGGKHFTIDRRDQLQPLGVKNADGDDLCVTGTQVGWRNTKL
jgi:hypothetical protein